MKIKLCLRSVCHIGKFIVEANFGRCLGCCQLSTVTVLLIFLWLDSL